MKYIVSLLLIATFLSCSTKNKSLILTKASKTVNKALSTFPFELRDDNQLYIKVKVNEIDSLIFIIDTGASSYVVVDSIARNKLKLKFDGEDINVGATSTSIVKSSSNNKIEIGNINIKNLTLYSIPYENVDFDGIIGCEFFINYVVSINYDRGTIKLYDPKTFKYSGNKRKIEVKMDEGVPLIKSSFMVKDSLFNGWFMLDTGADDKVSFNTPAVKKLNLEEELRIVGSSTSRDSNGELYKSPLGLIKEIKISNYSFYNVIAALSNAQEGSQISEEYVGAFGNVVLNKMNIIYDLANDCLYLEPKFFQ
ncbi:aspartyl protease family protein [uncultured Algibacter sp.]|uniref:aspartyl protease family protein n=1 Tax=uncultured Algibacter sp. TaxID=298659 RepID=UPI0026184429|nr:aspartyl protease family protein [uncultured Algibacter sp.]